MKTVINDYKDAEQISSKMTNSLPPSKVKAPVFQFLPNIHKPNNAGTLVINSVDCHTSRISEFVDHYLQPGVTNFKSNVKDMTDFVKKIENVNNITYDSYLVSFDVRSLYTNISHTEVIKAVKNYLQKSKPSITISIIITFLRLILTLNNFVFNGVNHLQKKGCAVGTKCAPSYANLFMGWFEKHFIYPLILRFSKIYLRYIDDIFIIWNRTKEEFEVFLQKISNCHPTIKSEYQISKTEITFLNTTVLKVGSQLRPKLYTKPTDNQSFLHIKSEHPRSVKNCIVYSQAFCCYNKSDLEKSCQKY